MPLAAVDSAAALFERPASVLGRSMASAFMHLSVCGRWRSAKYTRLCNHPWSDHCLGTGVIALGSKYFDTELKPQSGVILSNPTYQCCEACASEPAPED